MGTSDTSLFMRPRRKIHAHCPESVRQAVRSPGECKSSSIQGSHNIGDRFCLNGASQPLQEDASFMLLVPEEGKSVGKSCGGVKVDVPSTWKGWRLGYRRRKTRSTTSQCAHKHFPFPFRGLSCSCSSLSCGYAQASPITALAEGSWSSQGCHTFCFCFACLSFFRADIERHSAMEFVRSLALRHD